MIWLLLILAAAAVAAWFYWPQFKAFVDGSKTYIAAGLVVVGQVVEVIDEQLLSQALGLDGQGKAMLFIGLGVAAVLFRAMSKKPGVLVKKT